MPFLEPLLGSTNAERVLMYIFARDEGYTREIARFFDADPDSIQKQLSRMENEGILVSKPLGRTILYRFNPRYIFLSELESLLEKALTFYPDSEQNRLLLDRRRPRKKDKPL